MRICFEVLDKIRRVCNVINSGLVSRLQSLSHRHDKASFCLFYEHFFLSQLFWWAWLSPWCLACMNLNILLDWHLGPTVLLLKWLYTTVSSTLIVSFIAFGILFQFLAQCDLQCSNLKWDVSHHLLSSWSLLSSFLLTKIFSFNFKPNKLQRFLVALLSCLAWNIFFSNWHTRFFKT